MRLPLDELKTAFYQRLAGALAPTAVYDFVPDGTAYPYVTVGEMTVADWSDKRTGGTEITCQVHVFSEYKGYREVHRLMDDALQAVTSEALALTGFTVILQRMDFCQSWRDQDTQHGVLRIRMKVMEG